MKLFSPGSLAVFVSTVVVQSSVDPRAYSTNDTERHEYNAGRTLSIGWMLYEGYLPLDLWGPLQIVTSLSSTYPMTLALIGKQIGPISNADPTSPNTLTHSILATHTPSTAPPLDLLLLPGGLGNRANKTFWMNPFITSRYASTAHFATVCTGSLILAQAGLLDHRRATTNKWAWDTVVPWGRNVTWVPNARWTVDEGGKLWTSSGVAAGMDMMFALLGWMYGFEEVNRTMNVLELAPHTRAGWDPYAVVWDVPGADRSSPLTDVVGPAGWV